MSNSKNVIASKKESTKNVEVKETTKDLSKLSLDEILLLDESELDEAIINKLLNLNKEVKSFSVKKSKTGSSKLYKDNAIKENESSKQFRNRIRKERNNLISQVNYASSINDKAILKTSIESFNKFYKETYSLNDYSLESLLRKNSDKDTLVNCKLALITIKKNK
jgi:hypothetical protein